MLVFAGRTVATRCGVVARSDSRESWTSRISEKVLSVLPSS